MDVIADRYDKQAAELEGRAGVVRKVLVTDRLTVGKNAPIEAVAEGARRAGED